MGDTCVSLDPSGLTTYMSSGPDRSDLNAILDPSGDHRGSLASSRPSVCVTCVSSDPSGLKTYMSQVPSMSDSNAILDPSGDHRGSEAPYLPPVGDTCVRPVPSGLTTYMSSVPSLPDLNAILDPSGDHSGSRAYPTSACDTCTTSNVRESACAVDVGGVGVAVGWVLAKELVLPRVSEV